MLLKSKIFVASQIRWCSSGTRPKLVEAFNTLLENKESKHRLHPGKIKKKVISLPAPILDAMKIILQDVPNRSQIYAECIEFKRHLSGRPAPLEDVEKTELHENEHLNLLKNININDLSNEDLQIMRKRNETKVSKLLKQKVLFWNEINYDKHTSLLYMTGRSLQNYVVLHAIFNEICTRDQNFIPRSVLDFGSGIGSTTWAVNEIWPLKVKEFVNVDISNEISDLSEKIIKILYPNFSGTFYRQFMPISLKPNYDITVSAYSLIELPNVKARLDVIMKLWKKTKNYLVIVEEGSKAGFQLVNEARDFVVHLSKLSTKKGYSEGTHIFAPCPHDFTCPKVAEGLKPCIFEAGYNSLPLLGSSTTKYERYAYVVFKKGTKSEDWPRLINPPLKRGKHVICRMCNSSGNLSEIIFTPSKHGRNLYRCARSSKWGDRIPLEYNTENDISVDEKSAIENEEESENLPENKDKNITECEDVTNQIDKEKL